MTILTTTEIPYTGSITENPEMAAVIDDQINNNLTLLEFQREFKLQYLDYDSLGFNIFKAYNYLELPIEIMEDFLEHTHVNIIRIPDYDIPNLAVAKKEFIVKALYEILIIDIPSEIENMQLESSISMRKSLLDFYNLKIEILSELTQTTTWELLKYHFAIDLFNNELDEFIGNYALPIKNK